MDLAWLAGLGVLLLVAGLSALAYDTVRRKNLNQPYPFPEQTTRLLEEDFLPTLSPQAPPVPLPRPSRLPIFTPLKRPKRAPRAERAAFPRKPRLAGIRRLASPFGALGSVWWIAAGGLLSLGLVGVGVAALGLSARPSAAPGSIVVGISRFVNAPPVGDPAETLSAELLKAAASRGMVNVILRSSQAQPSTTEDAEAERERLRADFLVWGEVGAGGELTAALTLAPSFSPGQQPWQQWTSREPSILLFPHHSLLRLTPTSGIYPLLPLSLALIELKEGDYREAERAASGAQATVEDAGGSGGLAYLIQAAAHTAAGNYADGITVYERMESAGYMSPEARANRAFARLNLADVTGAKADLDRVTLERDTDERTLAMAYLLRARATSRQGGDAVSAMSELDESLRLRPDYLPARLDKAQLFYRLAQPDAARAELEALLKAAPDAAPAHRLMGLIWLMLGKTPEAQRAFGQAHMVYSGWLSELRSTEAAAQAGGDAAAASAATEGILVLNRELSTVYLYQGMALADQGRTEPPESFLGGIWRRIRGEQTTYERALALLGEAARLDPRGIEAYLQMGSIYTATGDTARAAQAIQQARELQPDAPQPYLALAKLQESQNNPREAARTLEELVSRAPLAYEVYQELHRLYLKSGDQAAASGALERALSASPVSAADRLWRGKFLKVLGRRAEAQVELTAASADPSLWEAHLLMGQILLEDGNGPDALAHFQAALEQQPNEPSALLSAGRLLASAGRIGEAEQLFSRLTTLSPANVEGHIAYSELLLRKGEIEKAIEEAKRAVQADDSRADAHFYLGLAYSAQKEWPSATTHFKAATERDPNNFEAFIRLAGSLFNEDRYTESLQASEAAIKLRGDDPQGHRWKAEAHLALRDADSSLSAAGESLRLAPRSVEALSVAARAALLKGDGAAARTYAEQAAAESGPDSGGLLALGEVNLGLGRAEEALRAYRAALAATPGSAAALTGEGRALQALGEREKALELFATALGSDGKYAEARLYAGHTQVEMGRWDLALAEYGNAVRLRPNWPEALYYLGRAYLQRKELAKAQQAFQRATDYSPNLVEAWFGLGIAGRDLGNREAAVNALRRATELNRSYADAWLYLALTLEESGEQAQAREAFNNAIATATDATTRNQAEEGLRRVR